MKTVFKNTVAETCKSCYACVRACPSKAIRVAGGQARIEVDRCVHCGQCVTVCTHGEWVIKRDQALVRGLLNSSDPVAVVLDTAFPAAFPDMDHRELVGRIRSLGFDIVTEASFGADLVVLHQKQQLENPRETVQVSSWCPATVGFVRKFAPTQLNDLAETVTPMTAMARVLRRLHGDNLRVVYVSPCAAHKATLNTEERLEAQTQDKDFDVHAVLTFNELSEMLEADALMRLSIDADGKLKTTGNPDLTGAAALEAD